MSLPITKMARRMSGFEPILAAIRSRLGLVESFLSDQVGAGPGQVRDAASYVLEAGGKRLRPAILLLVSKAFGYQGDDDIRYGAVVEMIHTATLVHDDVIDHSSVRRGRVTANHRWGDQLSVLLGDWLYTKALELALDRNNIDAMRMLSRATEAMTAGEILALSLQRQMKVDIDEYLDITRRKTGELFAAATALPSCFIPAAQTYREALLGYGTNLGLCFQIVDDLLDVTASESSLGKPVFSDLREGKLTLPFILLLPSLNVGQRRTIQNIVQTGQFSDTSPDELRELLETQGAIDQTKAMAREFADRASLLAAGLPPSRERDALFQAPTLLVDRDF